MADANAATQRHLFIDLYRTAVIVLMLEGHVVRALLAPDLQQTWLFQIHEFFHGLSAPAFLFGAGMTFVISTRKRWEEYHHWDRALARRVGRFLLVISLGLVLHLPFFSIRKIVIDGTMADFLQLFQCDVLACIGIGLLSLHGILFFFKNEKHFYGLVITTVLAVCLLTPLVWDIDFLLYLPPPLAQLMSSSHGSPFPMFPYVGFLFSGVIVSWEFLGAVRHGKQKVFSLKLAVLGASLIALGMILDAVPIRIYPHYDFWYTSPNYFLIRVGALMLMAAGFQWLAPRLNIRSSAVTVLGRESLFVYVLHLILLYGTAANPDANLRFIIGASLNVLEAVGFFMGFSIVMFACAMFWNYLKRKEGNGFRIMLQLAGSGMFLYYLFTRDF